MDRENPAGEIRRGRLYVISGPSGAGKGTLVQGLLKRFPGLTLSISATTRPPRHNEEDGREYYFSEEPDFLGQVQADSFLEWAKLYGYYYGTPRGRVEDLLNAGKSVILEIDVQGARQVKTRMQSALGIFIEPPSLVELENRLHSRGSENAEDVKKRVDHAEQELQQGSDFEHRIVNDDLEKALDELIEIVERCEEQR